MAKNLLLCARRLNDEDWKAIAFALRRKGYLTQYLNWEIAATACKELLLKDRDVVIAALREAAPLYLAAHGTIRKLQRKRRRRQRPIP